MAPIHLCLVSVTEGREVDLYCPGKNFSSFLCYPINILLGYLQTNRMLPEKSKRQCLPMPKNEQNTSTILQIKLTSNYSSLYQHRFGMASIVRGRVNLLVCHVIFHLQLSSLSEKRVLLRTWGYFVFPNFTYQTWIELLESLLTMVRYGINRQRQNERSMSHNISSAAFVFISDKVFLRTWGCFVLTS